MSDRGYSITEGVISPEECDELFAAMAGSFIGLGRAGTRRMMLHACVFMMAFDARLVRIAREFIGKTAVPFRATLFEKTGRTNWLIAWHQDRGLPLLSKCDSPDWGPWTIKDEIQHAVAPGWALERVIALRLHLDDSTTTNGPLRVIPDSHRGGVLSEVEVSAQVARGPVVECTVAKGGVIAMRPLLIHASSKCIEDLPRRVLHIEYADALELAPGIRLKVA